MTTIDSATLQRLGLGTPVASGRSELGQGDFLELMVTQLKNQDPFKPLESGEFLGQIAQFSTVAGIQDLQTSFAGVSAALYSNQALQASGLVGRQVLVQGQFVPWTGAGRFSGAVDLRAAASSVSVKIIGPGGQVLRTLQLGARASGLATFDWDGLTDAGAPVPPGLYRMEAAAISGKGQEAMATLATTRVDSVNLGGAGQGVTLNLSGLGVVDLSEVRQIK